jgi:hypothetical protein
MNNDKQSYSKPELIVHGDVEQITQQAGEQNSDVQPAFPTPLSRYHHRFKRPSGLTTDEAEERGDSFESCPAFLCAVHQCGTCRLCAELYGRRPYSDEFGGCAPSGCSCK